MDSVLRLLDSAEETWRDTVRTEFPSFAAMPVEKAKPDPKQKRHWKFCTDGEVIHMDILKPDLVASLFETVVKDLYRQAYNKPIADEKELVERLIHDTLTYLYFHETLHPAVTPDSKDDEKAADKALYDGIKKAEPHAPKADTLHKVGNVRNAMWDTIIDDIFFHRSNYSNGLERRLERVLEQKQGIGLPEVHSLPDGVVPVFDVMEIHLSTKERKEGKKEEGFKTLFYPITRLMYGLLFVKDAGMRRGIADFFKQALAPYIREDELRAAVTGALKGAVKELDQKQASLARVDRQAFETAVDSLYMSYGDAAVDSRHKEVIETLTRVFSDKRTRYAAIKGFIQPLAKYVSLEREEKRHGTHVSDENSDGSGQQDGQSSDNQGGGNMQQALLNLADELGQQEGNSLLLSVANNPSGSMGGMGIRDQKVKLLATDEYYKRNAKGISIRSPRQEAVKVDLGKRQVWEKVETCYIRPEDLHNLPLDQILQFQAQTGITQLIQLTDYEWRYDIYELRETEEFDYSFEAKGLELPKNIVFHLDSSSSMGSAEFVGTGQPYDNLMHVVYGILKPMLEAAQEMKAEVNVVAANFSSGTIVCDKPAELKHLYETPFNETKKVLLGFQGGGTEYDISAFGKIKGMLVPGKTVHVWVSDGGLGNTMAAYSAVERMVQDPDTIFLCFEIGGTSSFGAMIKELEKRRPNVKQYPVRSLSEIQSSTLEVVLQYDDNKRYAQQ